MARHLAGRTIAIRQNKQEAHKRRRPAKWLRFGPSAPNVPACAASLHATRHDAACRVDQNDRSELDFSIHTSPLAEWTVPDYMLAMMSSAEFNRQGSMGAVATRNLSPSKHRDERPDNH
jgi:hypothetical protein